LSQEEKEAEEQIFAPLGMSFPSSPFGSPEDMKSLPQGVPEDHKCRKQCWGKDAEHKKGGCMMVCNPSGKETSEAMPMAGGEKPAAKAGGEKPAALLKGRGKAKGKVKVAAAKRFPTGDEPDVAHNELPQFKQASTKGGPPSVDLVNRPASSTSVMALCLFATGASGFLVLYVKHLRARPTIAEESLLGYSGEYVTITE